MFKSIQNKIKETYNRHEEYLTDHYPKNYFNYHIDIGARGVSQPWHINNVAEANPNTICIGYEPDLPYYEELKKHAERLHNLTMSSCGFSSQKSIQIPNGNAQTVTLKDIILENNIDIDSRWAIKFDCEGCEYCLLKEESNIDILKKASHIALEFHNVKMGGNFFKHKYDLPSSFDYGETWMNDNFKETHSIFLTSKEDGLRTYVLISQEVMNEKDNLFWSSLL